eukprot:4764156-Alexandrium_andersonii.AAC.1
MVLLAVVLGTGEDGDDDDDDEGMLLDHPNECYTNARTKHAGYDDDGGRGMAREVIGVADDAEGGCMRTHKHVAFQCKPSQATNDMQPKQTSLQCKTNRKPKDMRPTRNSYATALLATAASSQLPADKCTDRCLRT